MQQEKGMIIKIDMANASDMVHPSFLFVVLMKFAFSEKVIDWIKLGLRALDSPSSKW